MFGMIAMVYGVVAGLAVLLQARALLAGRNSCGVSARFFTTYAGGYAIWLLYGLSRHDAPLVVVDAVGLVSAATTLAVILTLRGSLLRPTTWSQCGSAHSL